MAKRSSWSRRLVIGLLLVGALIGAYFGLRTRVTWLDSFDGTILSRVEDQIATVQRDLPERISKYYLEIATDDGRSVRIEVEQLTYFRAREGMRVAKAPFSSAISLGDR